LAQALIASRRGLREPRKFAAGGGCGIGAALGRAAYVRCAGLGHSSWERCEEKVAFEAPGIP